MPNLKVREMRRRQLKELVNRADQSIGEKQRRIARAKPPKHKGKDGKKKKAKDRIKDKSESTDLGNGDDSDEPNHVDAK